MGFLGIFFQREGMYYSFSLPLSYCWQLDVMARALSMLSWITEAKPIWRRNYWKKKKKSRSLKTLEQPYQPWTAHLYVSFTGKRNKLLSWLKHYFSGLFHSSWTKVQLQQCAHTVTGPLGRLPWKRMWTLYHLTPSRKFYNKQRSFGLSRILQTSLDLKGEKTKAKTWISSWNF